MEQKYRMLEVGEVIQDGDEYNRGEIIPTIWRPVDSLYFGRRVGHKNVRRPIPAEEIPAASWYDQRAELADAKNQITDLTRRLEDALSDKVIAEKRLKNLERHVEEEHVASWARIRKVLPESSEDSWSSLVDDIIGYIQNLELQNYDKDTTIRRLQREKLESIGPYVEITNTKQELENLTKLWYDQRTELADAKNQITDLTRRLEDALSDKVIAEKNCEVLRKTRNHTSEENAMLRSTIRNYEEVFAHRTDAETFVAALRKFLAKANFAA